MMGDPLREVARHRFGKIVSTDEDMHMIGLLGEEQSRLAGRIRASHDNRIVANTCSGFELGRGVVDTAAFELGDTGDCVQSAVLDATGDDDGPGHDVALVIEPDQEPIRDAAYNSLTVRGETSRAPNLTACNIASRASSRPETPRGKPR